MHYDTRCGQFDCAEHCTWSGSHRVESLARWLLTRPLAYRREFVAKRGSADLKAALLRITEENRNGKT